MSYCDQLRNILVTIDDERHLDADDEYKLLKKEVEVARVSNPTCFGLRVGRR